MGLQCKTLKEGTKVAIEKRVRQDCNRFWLYEMRILPVEDWEPNEGWRICAISACKESVEIAAGIKQREAG